MLINLKDVGYKEDLRINPSQIVSIEVEKGKMAIINMSNGDKIEFDMKDGFNDTKEIELIRQLTTL